MTVTETRNKATKHGHPIAQMKQGEYGYEVELEITNVDLLLSNLNNEAVFRSIIRRFL